MSPNADSRGIVLVCDRDGIVQRVIRDDLDLSNRFRVGSPVNDLVDFGCEKLRGFFEELRTLEAAYDWELTVPTDGTLVALHFSGTSINAEYLIVAACSRSGITQLSDELMRINNEQTNAMRTTAKELSLVVEKRGGRDNSMLEEMTRLNNEMANLQRELAKKNVQLEKLNSQKNQLLGMAAHDLRSPLGIILSYAEFLESDAADVLNEEQREFVTTIKATSDFMLRMVTDILDVSSIEAGQLTLDRQPGDLSRLVQHNVMLHRVLATKKDIAVEYDPPGGLPKLSFDAGKVEQVLNNLISNAIKFSHRGTQVKVQTTHTDEAVTVAVQDQGQGIPSADLTKLFKPFSKASVRGTEGEQSTGLGLAIVQRIVDGHGGRIWVDSVVGLGSTFYFTLPLS